MQEIDRPVQLSTQEAIERIARIAFEAPAKWTPEQDEAYQAFQRTFKQPLVLALTRVAILTRRWAEDFAHGDLEEGSAGRKLLNDMLAALQELGALGSS